MTLYGKGHIFELSLPAALNIFDDSLAFFIGLAD